MALNVFFEVQGEKGSLCELFALRNRIFLFVSFRACCVIAVAMILPNKQGFIILSE